MKKYFVYCDGAVEPKNPGGWGVGGYVIKDENGLVIDKGAVDLGRVPTMTNNIAEYSAVTAALKKLLANGWTDGPVSVHSDSQLVIRQVTDQYRCQSKTLRPLRDEIWILLEQFPHGVLFFWIPREENTEADAMSRSLYPWTEINWDNHVWYDPARIKLWKAMKGKKQNDAK